MDNWTGGLASVSGSGGGTLMVGTLLELFGTRCELGTSHEMAGKRGEGEKGERRLSREPSASALVIRQRVEEVPAPSYICLPPKVGLVPATYDLPADAQAIGRAGGCCYGGRVTKRNC